MSQPFTSFHQFKQRYPIRPNDAEMLLGSGSYGRVIRVEDQLETEWVAIKISEFKGNDTKSLKAEVELAQRVPRQGNIARYDACYRLETDTSLCDFAIMKYYPDGNLADLLKKQPLTPPQIHDITRGILLGLQHLHRHRIVHRDFKPANILISRDNAGRFIPKIADFGLSKLVNDDELDSSDFDLSDGRGTPSYKAPEQIEGSRVSFNLDLWAFGVILYEMLAGEKPFRADLRNSSEQSIRREIEKKIVTVELPARVDTIQEPYRTMIRRCLVRDIHERVRKEDELLDLLDAIPQRLTEARQHMANGQYDEAVLLYEEILRGSPTQPEAIQGLATCLATLRPRPAPVMAPPAEATDVYEKPPVCEEATDVYAASPEPTPVETPIAKPVPVRIPTPKKRTQQSTFILAALAAGGILVYAVLNGQQTTSSTGTKTDSTAISTGSVSPTISGTKDPVPPVEGNGTTDNKAALTKRIDVALAKARNAFRQGDFVRAVELTASALQLDPTRRDVRQLHNLALNQKPAGSPIGSPQTAAVVPTPIPSEPAPVKTTEDAAVAEKSQRQQAEYDQLIEAGVKAIDNGNNKAKAITDFSRAAALASEHKLNTSKAEGAYGRYLSKANKIFANDEFDGAKDWYKVAQALRDTPEVRMRIKQCNNQ
ncbi:serine/threonine-protein kinase [Spirosoma montaniterrae]|uniref:Serine/threonine protein kinase n=1 Tax=Spirosoma montaniterrae TaxID=1178516 RepID=A0A1P9X3I3_9BACT|nr:serine/threonine-protein kinase [Spirosoma montaniterrae]AQG82155.1 serine/threonine protein kinase [Spirosoma montaniterrae]